MSFMQKYLSLGRPGWGLFTATAEPSFAKAQSTLNNNKDTIMLCQLLFGTCIVAEKLLGAPGIATRSKDATRGSWPYY